MNGTQSTSVLFKTPQALPRFKIEAPPPLMRLKDTHPKGLVLQKPPKPH